MSELSTKIATLLQKQFHAELESSQLYLAMSAFFSRGAFKGFAHWMRVQANEERAHAMKLYDYLLSRGAAVILSALKAPKTEYKSPSDVFKAAYEAEKSATASINAIYDAALSAKDFATTEFLNWFVKEQVEEEDSALEVFDRVSLAGADTSALLQLDLEASKRK